MNRGWRGGRGERRGGVRPAIFDSLGAMEQRINAVSGQIVDAAMRVHRELGPGLLESAYLACLIHELRKRGLEVQSQVSLPIIYDGVRLQCGLSTGPSGRRNRHCRGQSDREPTPDPRSTDPLLSQAERPQGGPPDQLSRSSPQGWHQTLRQPFLTRPLPRHPSDPRSSAALSALRGSIAVIF